MKFNMKNKASGAIGETLACKYLKNQRYEIIARNYKNKIGEIDIIAKQDSLIVFVEVKARGSKIFGSPCQAVTYPKQRTIRRCAEYFLVVNDAYGNFDVRFDVIEVLDKEINHIENAF